MNLLARLFRFLYAVVIIQRNGERRLALMVVSKHQRWGFTWDRGIQRFLHRLVAQ
jgi:hypothetical protein